MQKEAKVRAEEKEYLQNAEEEGEGLARESDTFKTKTAMAAVKGPFDEAKADIRRAL